MSWLAAALNDTAASSPATSIDTFRSHIDPAWIEAALAATGTASLRRRRLPAEQVIWLVLGMALMRNRSITEIAAKLDLVLPKTNSDAGVAPSALVQARSRLGKEPVQWLFRYCSRQWSHASARRHAWRGLALYAIDGTTLRVADSETNRDHFGVPNGGEGNDGGYPVVRMTALMAVRSHLIADAELGAYGTSEHALAERHWAEIPNDSLTMFDKNYLAAKILVGLPRMGHNRNWLARAKKSSRYRVIKSLGPHDELVEFKVSPQARAQDQSLPTTFTARAIHYQRSDSKGPECLLTSLLDAEQYPADELVALYHERWEIELGYSEIKTRMLEREETIRSRTVDGVQQELWGVLLAYNLVRLEMERAAAEIDIPPSRISFIAALRLIRDEWLWCAVASPGTIPEKLRRMRENILEYVLPPRRSERRYPRAVKVATSKYPKKHRQKPPQCLN
jgi:hypothetical protein